MSVRCIADDWRKIPWCAQNFGAQNALIDCRGPKRCILAGILNCLQSTDCRACQIKENDTPKVSKRFIAVDWRKLPCFAQNFGAQDELIDCHGPKRCILAIIMNCLQCTDCRAWQSKENDTPKVSVRCIAVDWRKIPLCAPNFGAQNVLLDCRWTKRCILAGI